MQRYTFLFLFTILSLSCFAQPGGDRPSGSVIVESRADLRVADANAIEIQPQPENLEVEKPNIIYQPQALLFLRGIETPGLKAPALTKTAVEDLYHNYVKGSIGNYSDIRFDFFYNTLRSKTSLLAIQGSHHSGTGPVKNSPFASDVIDVFGRKVLKWGVFDGRIGFDRNAIRYYGDLSEDTTDATLPTDSLKNAFNHFYVSTGLSNRPKDSGAIKIGGTIGYHNFTDKYKNSENDISLGGKLTESLGNGAVLANAIVHFMPFSNSDSTINRSLFEGQGTYAFLYQSFKLEGGLGVANSADGKGSSDFIIYPLFKATIGFAQGLGQAYAGVGGGVEKNTFRTFVSQNPFMTNTPDLRNISNLIKVFAGGSIGLGKIVSLNSDISFGNYRNIPFFVSRDSFSKRRFDIVYDTGSILKFNLGINFNIGDNLTITPGLMLTNYNLRNLAQPFHKPTAQIGLQAQYNANDKIILTAGIQYLNRRYSGSRDIISGDLTSLKPITDLNLGVKYRFNDREGNLGRLSSFVNLQNLLNNKYQIWYGYPTRGIQVLGGISYSFLPGKRGGR